MTTLPVLTPAQARDWDAAAAAAGRPLHTLMECAGRAVAQVAVDRFPARCRQGVLVATGPGNNGGDGWVAARALHAAGFSAWVAPSGPPRSELAQAQAGLARADGVREVEADGPWPAVGLLVDALLGTGASGVLQGGVAGLARRMADLDLPIVAVDGPTGLDLETGVHDGPFQARLTVTFGGYRRGHLLARDDCGDLTVVDIGLPAPDPAWPTLLTSRRAARGMRALLADMHKGDRGRVVIVGGAPGMPGAARIAARAAFGAGAGLVHLVAPRATTAELAGAEPDLQFRPQPFDGNLEAETRQLLERADAVILGPGLGRDRGRTALVIAVLAAGTCPVVLDADGLVAMQDRVDDLPLRARLRPILLTPHLGEFRALFPELAADASVDPWAAATAAAVRTGCTVLLKGVPTVVAAAGQAPVTIAAGNPGLATGGSGDCLAGLAAAVLAQGREPVRAAAIAAQALGEAGDVAARRRTARAMRPMDLVDALPDLWRHWARPADAGGMTRPPVLHELPRPELGT